MSTVARVMRDGDDTVLEYSNGRVELWSDLRREYVFQKQTGGRLKSLDYPITVKKVSDFKGALEVAKYAESHCGVRILRMDDLSFITNDLKYHFYAAHDCGVWAVFSANGYRVAGGQLNKLIDEAVACGFYAEKGIGDYLKDILIPGGWSVSDRNTLGIDDGALINETFCMVNDRDERISFSDQRKKISYTSGRGVFMASIPEAETRELAAEGAIKEINNQIRSLLLRVGECD